MTKSFAYLGIKKPISLYAPFLIVWDFTHKCNLNCKHCYSNSGAINEEELTTKEALAVVDQLADAGVTALAFSGGEPLSRKDFFEVANHAVKRGLYVSVATNGTLLTKENVQRLKQTGIHYVEISIDGATAKTHDTFRGVPGAFEKAVTGLRNCVEADLCACIATTATKSNLEEMPAIVSLAEEIGAERFTYFNFIPTGRAKAHFDQDLSAEEREKLMRYLLNRMSTGCKTTISHYRTATSTGCPAMSRSCGNWGSDDVYGAYANGTGKQESCSAGRFYWRMRSWKIVLFTFSARGCSPMRLFTHKRGQLENRKVPGYMVKLNTLQSLKEQGKPEGSLRKMRLQVHLRRMQSTVSRIP